MENRGVTDSQVGTKMVFDYKKECKEFYMPKNRPEIVEVPSMNFLSVWGKGDPNEEGGDYQKAFGLLYGIAFTIKMSRKADHEMDGFFDYAVPLCIMSSHTVYILSDTRKHSGAIFLL